MDKLQATIEELYKIEPFWSICNPCQCQGYCCIGADILVTDDEWSAIKERMRSLSDADKETIKQNLLQRQNCVFRAENKCLIHEVRPENCRYTPYQARIDQKDGEYIITYTQVALERCPHALGSARCHFQRAQQHIRAEEALRLQSSKFLLLPNFDRRTNYLCLNHLVSQDGERSARPISELIHKLFEWY